MPTYSDYSSVVSATTHPSTLGRSPKMHLYIHTPVVLFKARVNMPTITYPVENLTFDGVTVGAYTDIQPDMTLLLGTTEGADDLGRTRTKNIASSTQIPIPKTARGLEDGTLTVQDNAYITVLDDFRVWSRIPYFTPPPGTIVYKDTNIGVGDYQTEIPPKANTGPGFAGYIDPDTGVITVSFTASNSFTVVDGVTLDEFFWDLHGGTFETGTATDEDVIATFEPGFYWVSLSVVDSNGKGHTARCPVLAIDPADDPTIKKYTASYRMTQRGHTLDVEIFDTLDVPDGTLVMWWWDEAQDEFDREHMKFIGWHNSDDVGMKMQKRGYTTSTRLHCVDALGMLDLLPAFPQALERSEQVTWEYMPELSMHKVLWYLVLWHTTAGNVADLLLPSTVYDYDALRLDSVGGTLYEQINNRAESICPDHTLMCNHKGQLQFKRDWMLLDEEDRPPVIDVLSEDRWHAISFDYQRHPKVSVLRSSALVATDEWLIIDGHKDIPLAFAVAPADAYAFGQGTREESKEKQLVLDQETLNLVTGHRFARLNQRYGYFRIEETTGDIWLLDPAEMRRVTLEISAAKAAQRGLDFTSANGLIREITLRINYSKRGTSIQPQITWEKESFGYPAQTHIPEEEEQPDTDVPEPEEPTSPPDDGLFEGQDTIVGIGADGHIYRTEDFSAATPTWDDVDLSITDPFSWVVDPFSPGYINGTGDINGWIVNATDIYRVEDLFGATPSATSVHTFVDDSAEWRTIQASFGAYFAEGSNPWLLCVSYYPTTGTTALRSIDGGATWLGEEEVSPEVDTTSTPSPIGVYTSPKTPGLAYTAAFVDTGGSDGFVSTDWGETWERVNPPTVDDVEAPPPSIHYFSDNSSVPDVPAIPAWSYIYSAFIKGTQTQNNTIFVLPPEDAVRVVIEHEAEFSAYSEGNAGTNTTYNVGWPAFAVTTGGETDSPKEWTRHVTQSVWYGNREQLGEAGWDDRGDFINFETFMQSVVVSGSAAVGLYHRLRVTEIELESGLIYGPPDALGLIQPGDEHAGSIHLPWPDNDAENIAYYGSAAGGEYFLKRYTAGVLDDISPMHEDVMYGVNHYGFTVRTHDSNRQYVLLAGLSGDGDTAVFISSDYGDNFTLIEGPLSGGRPFQAAFSGDSSEVMYVWGPDEYMSYSEDGGATIEDKSGNLAALGALGFIGIAGGPTG